MANLASTYRNQGRWKEAEALEVQVMETRKTKLGADHPDTLTSMANLASTYRDQGWWKEAEELQAKELEICSRVLGEEHPSTLTSMANLASTFWNQGRWKEAEELEVQVMETRKRVLGEEHPDTLTSMANLASTYRDQGRWKEAEELEVQVIVERFVPKPFLPFKLLLSRTVMGACLLDATYQIAYYCWASYFSSYLQVVNGLTITQAGWVSGIFDIIAGLWLLFIGYLIRRTLHFKWLLVAAVPLYTLGEGLMIYFRQPHTNIGYIIMCQIMIAFAGSTMILGQQVSITSVAEHDEVSSCLALLGLFGYVGGAIGNSISGAIWTHTLPNYLQANLPKSAQADWETIYGDLDTQLSYPMGDPIREVIIQGYGQAQRRMLIAGTAIMALAFFFVAMMKNIKLNRQQTKGIVF